MTSRTLHRSALLLAGATLLLIATGALLTNSHGSTGFESVHRRTGEVVGLLAITFAVIAWRQEGRFWLKWLSVTAIAAVAGIGALGVSGAGGLALGTMSHLFFALTALFVLFTTPLWGEHPLSLDDDRRPSLRSLAVLTPAAILVQVVLGALYRHQVLGLMPHVIGAMLAGLLALVFGMFAMTQFAAEPALRKPGHALLMVTSLQVVLGIAAFTAKLLGEGEPGAWYLGLSAAHVAFGALTVGTTAVLSAQVLRHLRPRLDLKPATAS